MTYMAHQEAFGVFSTESSPDLFRHFLL